MNIVIFEYGMGNVGSIKNMFKKLGRTAMISDDAEEVARATHLVLPGVGAFDNGITKLRKAPAFETLERKVREDKIPLMGICLGMQLLTNSSEEGKLPGLGWIDAETRRFQLDSENPDHAGLKIPHMGWNEVTPKEGEFLYKGYEEIPRYYFVHAYHVCCRHEENSTGRTVHGYEYTSSIRKRNVMGVQFHPEKSHRFGLKLLENFASMDPDSL